MNKDLIYILVIVALVALYFLFPRKEVEIETEYLPGDTVTVMDTISVVDTVVYYTNTTHVDTLRLRDTIIVVYSSEFDLGNDTLGTSGTVAFDMDKFTFKDIEYTYPEFTNTVVDTLKITRTEHPAMYEDVWFWSTAVATLLLLLSLAGG